MGSRENFKKWEDKSRPDVSGSPCLNNQEEIMA